MSFNIALILLRKRVVKQHNLVLIHVYDLIFVYLYFIENYF